MPARKKPPTKALTTWDEELAKYAEAAAAVEANSGGGSFFSTAGGQLSWQDAPMPNNTMMVIILGSIFENVYYEGRYDPETPQGPTCFALNKDEDALAPHEVVVKLGQGQNESCEGCELNEWGSADVGRGKACRNTRRLAMVPAGNILKNSEFELIEDERHYATTQVGFMKLPVTSVKGYASFVKQVAGALKRPPFAIVTKVSLVPDAKTQFKVVFEPVENVPDELMTVIMKRREEVDATIDFPYTMDEEEEEKPKTRSRRAPAKKKATTRRAARKY